MILDGEFEHTQEALERIRIDNPAQYLLVITKLLPYWFPKAEEVTLIEKIELKPPSWFCNDVTIK